ncbi:glycine betaine ABC transporter substrate-binding protein [Paenibacillus yanchengensis]|uniref:Glycine betaine ABC transporter substrate-binding protein n=1 Tax=Paenibacillus yanchengensis TaxID=2035833 RepID=A0ABW4YRC7_9BACL
MFTRSGKFVMVTILLLMTLTLAACSAKGDTITLGSRNNTESIILSHIMGQLIEDKTDLKVKMKENLGGSNILWSGLLQGEIDLIPDYTGTIVANYYQQEPGTAEETLEKTKQLIANDGLTAFNAFGFNNTYTLSIDEKFAEENNIVTFSDFAAISDEYTLGCVFEFIDRPDGLPGFQKEYGIKFKEVKGMDHGMMYRSYGEKEINVINSYTTDGQLQVYDVRVLEDDKSFFPPYHAVPVIRQDTLAKYPELSEVLAVLENKIDEEAMQIMNGKVDNDGLRAKTVAKEFLEQAGLLN